MKIIHTADWHLGNTFHGHDRHDEQAYFLDHLVDLLKDEQPDALLIAGDVFDTSNPSAAAEKLFFDFLSHATAEVDGLQIVVVAGNHDSAARLEAPSAMLSTHRVFVRGTVQRLPSGEVNYTRHLIPLRQRSNDRVGALCLAVPFLRACDYPAGLAPAEGVTHFFRHLREAATEHRYTGVPLVAVAHFYAAGADICTDEHSERLVVGGQECVDVVRLPRGIAYTALGHIHKAQRVAGRDDVRYAGSVLPLSFSERTYRHGVVRVEIDDMGHVTTESIGLPLLRPLLSLPANGVSSADEMFRAIARLPKQQEGDLGAGWPYLEMKILETQPEPTLVSRLLDALAEAMLAENHTHSVPRADDDWRSFLIGNARSFRQALLAYRDGARIHAGTRPGAPQMETADAQLRFLCEAGFSAGDAVNALMTISYFTVGAVLEEQAGDSDAGERGGTVEQAPLSPLLRAAIDAFDEAGPDAAFEQGLAVIVDGLAKRRLVVRNVEGPRKGDD